MTSFLIYTITDMGIKIADLYEGYDNTEEDLAKLSQVIEGRLSRADFGSVDYGTTDSTVMELKTLTIMFGDDSKVKKVIKK